MRTTARFSIIRKRALGRVFSVKNLSAIWRSVVKGQMRTLDIIDLHDYYDFNSNITEKANEIRAQILKAEYKASSPLIYRLEKKYGICRHIMIPTPSDALVFQTVTEYLAPYVKNSQPTDKAYYSRDKHTLKLPHQLQLTPYPWFILWPKFQKDIWKFTDSCPYLVVTDITDFFDNIGLRELRHIVSAHLKVKEVVFDLLFNIIEQLAWVPDYLPTSQKGLPTINLEAFRLLPHVMLFEIDKVLDKQSNGNFVRWLDDINIGVNSKDEAFTILRNINDVLKSRGLALNISKTEIYTATDAKVHFMFDENIYLDQASKAEPSDPHFPQIKSEFLKHFRQHLKMSHLKNWDKVTKRYFTIAGQLNITGLTTYSYDLYMNHPSVRSYIIYYFTRLGFSKRRANIILSLIRDVKRYDDVSLYQLCRLITDLEIPRTKVGLEFINSLAKILKRGKSDLEFYSYLWFLAKYGEPHVLMTFIVRSKKRWINEHFLARQVVSVLPRLLSFNERDVTHLLNEQMTAGPRDAASVATSIHELLDTKKLSRHRQYLFPPKPQKPYPLPKYLILTTILSSKSLKPAQKRQAVDKVKVYVTDPWYLHWLRKYSLVD